MSLSCHFWTQKMRYYGSMEKVNDDGNHLSQGKMYILNGSIMWYQKSETSFNGMQIVCIR